MWFDCKVSWWEPDEDGLGESLHDDWDSALVVDFALADYIKMRTKELEAKGFTFESAQIWERKRDVQSYPYHHG